MEWKVRKLGVEVFVDAEDGLLVVPPDAIVVNAREAIDVGDREELELREIVVVLRVGVDARDGVGVEEGVHRVVEMFVAGTFGVAGSELRIHFGEYHESLVQGGHDGIHVKKKLPIVDVNGFQQPDRRIHTTLLPYKFI